MASQERNAQRIVSPSSSTNTKEIVFHGKQLDAGTTEYTLSLQATVEQQEQQQEEEQEEQQQQQLLTCREVFELMASSQPFSEQLSQEILRADPNAAGVRWETPALKLQNAKTQVFRFVVIRADSLQRQPDASYFAEHFQAGLPMATFYNLGRNAKLVAPAPSGSADFCHLLAFLRNSTVKQRYSLWKSVATAMTSALQEHPDKNWWLSTAGGGVPWLHVRMDLQPKYYHHSPYTYA